MKSSIILTFIMLSCSIFAQAQLEKDTWLVGGMGNFKTGKNQSLETAPSNQRSFTIQPDIGYFAIPKLVTGLRVSYESSRLSIIGQELISKTKVLGIGPFVRYYLLPEDYAVNFLVDGSYQYQNIKGGAIANGPESDLTYYTTERNSLQLSAGPVFYFNSVVGLETLLSYNNSKTKSYSGRNYFFQFSVGLQIHLQKM